MIKLSNLSEKNKYVATLLRVLKYLIPLLTPFICFVMTEYIWRHNANGILKSNPFVTINAFLILLNIMIFYAFWGLCYALIGRSSIASCITIIVSCIFGLANYYLIFFRNYPILASDFMSLKTAFAVSGSYSYVPPIKIIIILIFAIILLALNFIFKFRIKKMYKTYSKILIRVIPSLICICVIVGVTSFISQKNIRRVIPTFNNNLFVGISRAEDNGLVLSFVSTIQYTRIDKPDDYSEEKAKNILNKNKDDSVWNNSSISKTKPANNNFNTKVKKANIIVIMNESFSDIGILGDLKTNMDYMPYTRSLMKGAKNTISGYYYSSVIAGSTANTEFEYLSGDTMAFLPPNSVPYQQFITNKVDSVSWNLKAQDYTTVGTHPYVSYGWNRNKVYPLLGFDHQIFAVSMNNLRNIRLYTDDQSYYEYLEKDVFNRVSPLFSFNVTMQNHGGYIGSFNNFNVDVHMKNAKSDSTDQYLSLIKKSDDSFKDLISYFKKTKDPTIVVMFGDHQPNDYVVEPMYQLKGKTTKNLKGADNFERYKVPVIMWANYDIPEEKNLLTSANYLGGMVTKLAGCETSPYQNFLEKLRAKVPVICAQGFTGTDGKYKDLSKLDSYTKEINDYKILNYYSIFGE